MGAGIALQDPSAGRASDSTPLHQFAGEPLPMATLLCGAFGSGHPLGRMAAPPPGLGEKCSSRSPWPSRPRPAADSFTVRRDEIVWAGYEGWSRNSSAGPSTGMCTTVTAPSHTSLPPLACSLSGWATDWGLGLEPPPPTNGRGGEDAVSKKFHTFCHRLAKI